MCRGFPSRSCLFGFNQSLTLVHKISRMAEQSNNGRHNPFLTSATPHFVEPRPYSSLSDALTAPPSTASLNSTTPHTYIWQPYPSPGTFVRMRPQSYFRCGWMTFYVLCQASMEKVASLMHMPTEWNDKKKLDALHTAAVILYCPVVCLI